MLDKLQVDIVYGNVVNFSMQQNHVPVIKKITLHNNLETDLMDLKLCISVDPAFAYAWETSLQIIPARQFIDLDSIDIKLSAAYLYSLTERVSGTIFVRVEQNDECIALLDKAITVLAYDEWSGYLIMPEIISAFVTPNHPVIAGILKSASVFLENWTGSPSFTAYQSNNPNMARLQMAAIYTALQKEEIGYTVPPASYEDNGQRIRLCDAVLTQKLGTCLDLSLLYITCLEAIGLNPLIIFTKGHAFAGCWLEDQSFSEYIQDDSSFLTKRIAEGIHEICLVECTTFVKGKLFSFDAAVKAGEQNLLNIENFEMAIDIKRTRSSGIRPLPLRAVQEDGAFVAYQEILAQDDLKTTTIVEPEEIKLTEKLQGAENISFTKQQVWERKLLDLSLRNTLLNFRVTQSAIQVMATNLDELEDSLASGEEFQLMEKPNDFEHQMRNNKIFIADMHTSMLETLLQSEFKHRRLRTFLNATELESNIKQLYRKAKVSLDENGSNTLYLAVGFLKWYETKQSEKERYAPIVLIPIDIIYKSARKGYVIRLRDEDAQINITLLEMLRQDFGISIAGLDPLPLDESGIDLRLILNIVRQAVMDQSHWDVDELAFLGLFSFSQFIMWNDIRNRAEELQKNKIVKSLMSGKMEWENTTQIPLADTLDESYAPADLAVPISADSSQLAAVCGAGKDMSFVLHGPPGTGKSQTITNMIANALFQGKSVLFIAEKMAALSVVQKRLESIGLGSFCLELHSNKAVKRDVLNALDKTLHIGRMQHPEAYRREAERLHAMRQNLNAVVQAMHKKRDYGFSLYEILSHFEENRMVPDCIKISSAQLEKLQLEQYTLWMDLLKKFEIAGKECGGAYKNPLVAIRNAAYSQSYKQKLEEEYRIYQKDLTVLQIEKEKLAQIFHIDTKQKYDDVKELIDFGQFMLQCINLPKELVCYQSLKEIGKRVEKICACGKKSNEVRKQILEKFQLDIFDFDEKAARKAWNEATNNWVVTRFFGQRKILKELRTYASKPGSVTKETILNDFTRLSAYKEAIQMILREESFFSSLFKTSWNNMDTDWENFYKAYEDALELSKRIGTLTLDSKQKQDAIAFLAESVFPDIVDFQKRNKKQILQTEEVFHKITEQETRLADWMQKDWSEFHQANDWNALMLQQVDTWLSNLSGLGKWCNYLAVRGQLLIEDLHQTVDAYEQGLLQETEIITSFKRGIFYAAASTTIDNEPCLQNFSGAFIKEDMGKYKEVCNDFEQLTRAELIARLSADIPLVSQGVANSSEIGILQKAIRSGGRMLSIRKLFDSIPNLLRKLCPCMLMSPISVAQYIDPSYPQFDLVVFDEASQMPTCEAVGAIARGKNVVVVGDPKQLPPTSFFSSNRIDEDNFEKEDLESILDDCLAISMPQEHLLWHYRSRHESLIAFSNAHYYDNALFTFPSPNDRISEVSLIQLEGYYDRGKTKQNQAEAQAVVEEILLRLADPEKRQQSIGVVTFSSIQQIFIEDLLTEAFKQNPELEEINASAEEPIFIKNLENVQGDERDVILFSIGYGPDMQGKVSLNFGPLNRDRGWRRLNVAVSRARKKMIVFSVLRADQIDLTRTRAEGIAGLKAFLEFAQKGKIVLQAKTREIFARKQGIEEIIAQKIRELGYQVDTNIGCSHYKIDIGIINPDKKDEYLLGIMCDGKQYCNANTARDRNILQMQVLQSLGWKLCQLWALDWWENPEEVLEKIKEELQASKEIKFAPKQDATVEKTVYRKIASYVTPEPVHKEALEQHDYMISNLISPLQGADEFILSQNTQLILSQMKQVIETEAPISESLLCKRILQVWGIARMGARLQSRIPALFSLLDAFVMQTNTSKYFWKNEAMYASYDTFRIPTSETTRRNMENIAPEERINAIKYILKNQISLLKSDLIIEVYKLFGFSRKGTLTEEMICEALNMAEGKGIVRVDPDGRVFLGEAK